MQRPWGQRPGGAPGNSKGASVAGSELWGRGRKGQNRAGSTLKARRRPLLSSGHTGSHGCDVSRGIKGWSRGLNAPKGLRFRMEGPPCGAVWQTQGPGRQPGFPTRAQGSLDFTDKKQFIKPRFKLQL